MGHWGAGPGGVIERGESGLRAIGSPPAESPPANTYAAAHRPATGLAPRSQRVLLPTS